MVTIHRHSKGKMGLTVKDTGFKSICTKCSCRFDHDPDFIGVERELNYAVCPICVKKRENGVDRRRRHAVGRAGGGRSATPLLLEEA